MDWGLMEPNVKRRDQMLLREEIVYPSATYYYLAYIEDFIGLKLYFILF